MNQHDNLGVQWGQTTGILAGVALVVAIYIGFRWLERSRRSARNERPPQQTKLLRSPGHSILRRLDELNDKWTTAVTNALLSGLVFGLAFSTLYPLLVGLILGRITVSTLFAQPKSSAVFYLAITLLVSVVFLIRELARALKIDTEIRNCRFGLRGEQAVAEALSGSPVAAAGYVTFHDVPGDGPWNIDHVVVGPGGVFVLETKARPRRKSIRDQKEHVVVFDGKTLRFPWCEDSKAALQAERNAQWVKQYLADFAPKDLEVQPVVVLPGWFVENLGKYPIKAMNATYLASYIANSQQLFTQEQLRPLLRRLDERCRDQEF